MVQRIAVIGSTSATGAPSFRDDELQAWERDFLVSGVIKSIGSALAVVQRGAGANLSVDVGIGRAWYQITNTNLTPSKTYKICHDSDAVVNVLITAADPTNPRIDIICLKTDVSTNPNSGAGNIASIVAIAGTPAGSPAVPATPTNYFKLAEIAVAANAASIVTGNITDRRVYVTLNTQELPDVPRVSTLASIATGNGAALVGVEDAGNNYATATVEAVLAEIATNLAGTLTITQLGIYGDGNDGAVTWAADTNLDPATEKRYTTATLNSTKILSVTSANTPLIIKASGNVTINGTINLSGQGGPKGAGSSSGNGSAGTAGNSLVSGFTVGSGSGGSQGSSNTAGGGGAGGSSTLNLGAAGTAGTGASAGGPAPSTTISSNQLAMLASLLRGVACGGGGSGGARGQDGGTSRAGGDGGNGGGALVMVIGGNLTLGASSVINVSGAIGSNGTNGTNYGGGGGGGGGGGTAIIIVKGSITNSGVTLTTAGGTHGNGGTGGTAAGGIGGDGGAGKILIYSLSTGTLVTG